jgi:amino acid adenylation domain-containing protein
MEKAKQLISKLGALKIDLKLNGENLEIISYQSKVPKEVIHEIIASKQELIQYLKTLEIANQTIEIPVCDISKNYPLSSAQYRLWLTTQQDQNSLAYNMPAATYIHEKIDTKAFETAIKKTIEKHESLRTVFRLDVEGNIKQWVLPKESISFELAYHDVRNTQQQETAITEFLTEKFAETFDLENGPLLKAGCIQTQEAQYILYFNMHHIITDGWSMRVLQEEVFAQYKNVAAAETELRIQYKDFSVWEQQKLLEGYYEDHKKYWLETFSEEIPVLNLPSTKKRPAIKGNAGNSIAIQLSDALTTKLREYTKQNGVSTFIGMMASLRYMLSVYSSVKDSTIGIPVAGRTHADLENQIGFYVNMVPLRTQIETGETFASYVQKEKETYFNAIEFPYPFQELVNDLALQRDISRHPIFDILIDYYGIEDTALEANEVEFLKEIQHKNVRYDVEFHVREYANHLKVEVIYDTDIYEEEMFARFLENYTLFLEDALQNPTKDLQFVQTVNASETKLVINEFNQTTVAYPRNESIISVFEKQVIETPNAKAVVYQNREYTYAELNAAANQLAHCLVEKYNVQENDFVGILATRNEKAIVMMLAILKVGAVFSVIDAESPKSRLAFILEDINPKLLITDEAHVQQTHDFTGNLCIIDREFDKESYSKENLTKLPFKNRLAYIAYTSGSTGVPKGVMVNNRAVVRLVKNTNFITVVEEDNFLSFSNFSFDGSTFDIFMPLLNGATVYIANKTLFLDVQKINSYIIENKITSFFITPVLFNSLVDFELSGLAQLKYVICGGDRVSVKHAQKFNTLYPNVSLQNGYGPTENTTFSTWYKIQNLADDALSIPIGAPIANSQCYILNAQLQPLPFGVIGEICVAGDGLAEGYLNRDELTAEKFVDNPFQEGEKLYKTGDLGRWNANGEIEFFGRNDHQVKIRGYRIELGEIEHALLKIESIEKGAILVVEDASKQKNIVAYFTANEPQNIQKLETAFKSMVASFMVPNHFIQIEEMPLTLNGKVDRKALKNLPGTLLVDTDSYKAPTNELEANLVNIWNAYFQREDLGIAHDFFAIGGDSIKAIQLVNKMNVVHGKGAYTVAALYTNPTIEALAQTLETSKNAIEKETLRTAISTEFETLQENILAKANEKNIQTANWETVFPMSGIQKGLIFHSLLDEGVYILHPIQQFEDANFDFAIFKKAVEKVVQQHPMLRTSFNLYDFGQEVQIVHTNVDLATQLTFQDYREETSELQENIIETNIQQHAQQGFEISQPGLWRMKIFQLTDTTYKLAFIFHHAILDGWSYYGMLTEISKTYEAFKNQLPVLNLPIQLSYKDYVIEEYLNKENAKLIEYWTKKLADFQWNDLPFHAKSEEITTLENCQIHLETTLKNQVDAYIKQAKISEKAFYLAVAFKLIQVTTNQNDITIGVMSNGRQALKDGDKVLGCFTNSLPFRTQLSTETKGLVQHIAQEVRTLKEFETVSYFELKKLLSETDSFKKDYFNCTFNFTDFHITKNINSTFNGKEIALQQAEKSETAFNINVAAADDEVTIELSFYKGLFSEVQKQQLADYLQTIIHNFVNAEETSSVLSETEKIELLETFNETSVTYEEGKTVLDLLANQVTNNASKTAIISGETTLSYAELDKKSNQLANYIAKQNLPTESLIPLCLNRSIETIVGIFAILKAGHAYVPIDPTNPQARIDFILKDISAELILTESAFAERFTEASQKVLSLDNLSLEAESKTFEISVEESQLAYIIYTSGTTGTPKGVMIEHKSLFNFVNGFSDLYEFTENARIGFKTNYAFDVSVQEIFGWLKDGGSVVILPKEADKEAKGIIESIQTHKITHLNLVPSLFSVLLEELKQTDKEALSSLEYFFLAGEALAVQLVKDYHKLGFDAKLENIYGPTEATIYSSYFSTEYLKDEQTSVPIGKPTINTQLYILDDDLSLAPKGVIGELCISGKGLSKGYLNREELTAEKFVNNPFNENEKLYKTGDLAKWLPDGNIAYIGRKDDQVKIRGYRIELEEIETAIQSFDAEFSTVVVSPKQQQDTTVLVAYIIAKQLDKVALQAYLQMQLPAYMIPSYYILLEELPLTKSGKIDRKSLPEINKDALAITKTYDAPTTSTETKLVAIWEEMLTIQPIGITDNFFELGGNSLSALQLLSKIETAFQTKINLRGFFDNPTIVHIATEISQTEKIVNTTAISVAPTQEFYELSYAQKRFWLLHELSGQSTAYNLFISATLEVDFEKETFNKAIQLLLERHSSLRTTFVTENGIPKQKIHETNTISYKTEIYQDNAETVKNDVYNTRFELASWPLFRIAIVEETNELVFAIHHIIADGWSLEVFKRDLIEIYQSLRSASEINLPTLAIDYKDYATWEHNYLASEAVESSKNYWKNKLQSPLAKFQLPYDIEVKNSAAQNSGSYYNILLKGEIKEQLEKFSSKHQLRLLSILMGSFKILLQRLTNEKDLLIGIPMSVRSQAELAHQIGVYLNTVLIRNQVKTAQTGLEFLQEVNTSLIEAMEHQLYPYEKVVEQLDAARNQHNEFTSVFFNLLNYDDSNTANFEASEANAGKLETAVKFDLECYVKEYADAVSISCVYRDAVFHEETIAHWMCTFAKIVAHVINNTETKIAEIPVFSEPIYQIAKQPKTTSELSIESSIIAQFEAQVEKSPEAIAVTNENDVLKYGEVNQIANGIGKRILEKGTQNQRVALLLERGELQVLGILGTLKSGNSYVPLDSEFPVKRLQHIVKASESSLIITSQQNFALAEEIIQTTQIPILCIATTDEKVSENPSILTKATDEAYVLFTSGSTGVPKGVRQNQRNVLHFIKKHIENAAITANDVVSLLSTYSFDAYVVDVFSTLLTGGTLATYNIKSAGLQGLYKWIETQKVSVLHLVPSLFRAFVNLLKDDEKLTTRALVLGGEASFQTDFESFLAKFPQNSILVNIYGAAEASIISSKILSHESELNKQRIPLGNITEDANIFIAQNGELTQNIYVTGELVFQSEHATIGYLQQEQETTQNYHTGDITRILPNGDVEFIERANQQIKLNGIRIDLLEIELTIQKLVNQAVVIAKENALVAYLLENDQKHVAEIKTHLQEVLPKYMIPEMFVFVEDFPRTRTGKIDRNALPNPIEIQTETTILEVAETATEKELTSIWQELLKIETVGIQQNFFELGGHSLLAIQLIAHIQSKLEVEIAIKEIFENTTIKTLAKRIDSKASTLIPTIVPTERMAQIPLSYAQERLWFIDKLQGSLAYHIPSVLQIKGEVDTTILTQAITALVERHESLRTTIQEHDGEGFQQIKNTADFTVKFVKAATLENIDDVIQEETQKAFDLSSDYMLRATIIQQSETEHLLVLVLHHIAADGWSIPIFVNELETAYQQIELFDATNFQPLSVQYADYSVWQRNYLSGEILAKKLSYWTTKLQDVVPLALPIDFSRPAIQATQGETFIFEINKTLSDKIHEVSKVQETTLFMTLLSAYQVLLHQYSGQTDIAVGTPVANRSQLEIAELIGFFINTIVIRNQVYSEVSFAEFLQRMKETSLEAFAHQDVPFEKIVDQLVSDRDQSRTPIFQTLFVLQNNQEINSLRLGEAEVNLLDIKTTTAKFELSMTIRESDTGMTVALEYATALFKSETIQRLAIHFTQLLEAICADAEQSIGSLEFISKAEKVELLETFNETSVVYEEGKTVLDLLANQVEKNPLKTVIISNETTLSYADLDEKSNQLANYIAKQNLKSESLIPLCLNRSVETIIGIFAILKAGHAYVPIDPTNPQARIDFILEDVSAELILTESAFAERFSETSQKVLSLDQLSLEAESKTFETSVEESQLAYIIYTSGTTGTPKGVMIEHRSLFNFVNGFSDLYEFTENARIGFKTNYAFDVSVQEIFGWLKDGGSVVILPKDADKEAKGIIENIQKHKITHLNLVPSLFSVLLEELQQTDKEALSSLTYFFLAGEALPVQLVKDYHKLDFDAKLENIYGPTEATIYSSYFSTEHLKEEQTNVPIGKPTINTQLYILDDDLSLVPKGVIGELCISGKGLSKGYLNREELTKEKFVNNPFKENEKLYKTGDLAKWLPDGNIAYIGRKDDQVKIRGYRIELGEIETALDQLDNIKQSVVIAKEDSTGSKQLVAYFTAETAIEFTMIQEKLAKNLPSYMIPNLYKKLDEFPLNANGKINKKALPELDTNALQTETYIAPTTETEKQLVEIWEELLDVEKIGIKDNFFALGGHSLLAIKLITRISKVFETEITVKDVFHFVTIEEIAKYLEIFTEQDLEKDDEEITFF